MWLDLLVVGTLWLLSVVGVLMSQRKKPVSGCDRTQATRNTNQTNQ